MGNENSAPVTYGQRLLNDVRVEWKKNESVHIFASRDGHCAASIENRLFVFAGVCWDPEVSEVSESNEILMFDLGCHSWTKPVPGGQIPSPRSSATMAAVGNKLYVFGGVSRDSGWMNDLYCLDTETMQWREITGEGSPPSPRDKLRSVAMGAKILFFGGFGPISDSTDVQSGQAEFSWFNDLYSFDTENSAWEKLNMPFAGCPSPRAAHGMCLIGSKLVVFGGRDSVGRKNDLFVLDTETMELIQRPTTGRQPEPRSFHTITAVGNRVVVFGGRSLEDCHFNDLHIYDSDTHEWMQPVVTGTVPAARGVHTCTTVGEYLVLYGGSSEFDSETLQCQEYYGDIHYIHKDQLLAGKSQGIDPDDVMPTTSTASGFVAGREQLSSLEEEDSSEADISSDEQR